MALITPPSPQEVLHEANLPLASYGLEGDDQDELRAAALREINGILPDIVKAINREIDRKARPHDFPFSIAVLSAVEPTKTEDQIEEMRDGQESAARMWMLSAAAARMVGRAVPRQRTSPGQSSPVKDRYEELKEQREDYKKSTLEEIEFVAGQTAEGAAEQAEDRPQSTSAVMEAVWF